METIAFFYFRKGGVLRGVAVVHVDDFFTAGDDEFKSEVTDNICKTFKCSKRETDSFRFTGIDIERNSEGEIVTNQSKFAESLTAIPINSNDSKKALDKKEYKDYRGTIGKLSWISEQTNPAIAFETLELSFNNKNATVSDLRRANKVIKKAKENPQKLKFSTIGKYDC